MSEEKKIVKGWPVLTIASDDLTMEADGQTFAPHAGEWVKLIRRMGPSEMKIVSECQSAGEVNLTTDEGRDLFDRICALLAHMMVDWNWTGPDGEAYPKPTAEVLGQLTYEEIGWLMARYTEPMSKNSPT